MERLIFTVTNDLNHDRRMMRICTSLSQAGFKVLLTGVKKRGAAPLQQRPYEQKRLSSLFSLGFWFYAEYNTRLFFYLLFTKADAICAIDMDTIGAVWLASRLRGVKRICDAHEYFSQQKEIITRPCVYKVWHWIERTFLPKFPKGYTVSESIAVAFKEKYGVSYGVIRNLPSIKTFDNPDLNKEKIILYQGAVNEARGLEYLVPAMKDVDAVLHIYGDGNFVEQTKNSIALNNLSDKVLIRDQVLPEELDSITQKALIGINLVENNGLNQYYSLANKFFDYIRHAVPQVTMNFPEYKKINDQYQVAVLIDDLQVETIAAAINQLINDKELYGRLRNNCLKAREVLNWGQEEKKLIKFYNEMFNRGDGETQSG